MPLLCLQTTPWTWPPGALGPFRTLLGELDLKFSEQLLGSFCTWLGALPLSIPIPSSALTTQCPLQAALPTALPHQPAPSPRGPAIRQGLVPCGR